jgi:virulence-associated protein VagC
MTKIAKLFRNGTVRPFVFLKTCGSRATVCAFERSGDTVILEPVITNVEEWFAEMDRHEAADAFQGDWRNQPKAPKRKIFE